MCDLVAAIYMKKLYAALSAFMLYSDLQLDRYWKYEAYVNI